MNPIEEAIDAISSASWAELLASGGSIIIACWMVFVLIDQGKRLLRITANVYGDDPDNPGACIGCGRLLEDGVVCEDCFADSVPLSEVEAAEESCPYGYHADGSERTEAEHDEDYLEFLRDADPQEAAAYAEEHGLGEDDKAGYYEEYHELLDSGDEEAAQQLAEDHGLDVDWHKHTLNLIQGVIDSGDLALADTMCNDSGIDKLELDWH